MGTRAIRSRYALERTDGIPSCDPCSMCPTECRRGYYSLAARSKVLLNHAWGPSPLALERVHGRPLADYDWHGVLAAHSYYCFHNRLVVGDTYRPDLRYEAASSLVRAI